MAGISGTGNKLIKGPYRKRHQGSHQFDAIDVTGNNRLQGSSTEFTTSDSSTAVGVLRVPMNPNEVYSVKVTAVGATDDVSTCYVGGVVALFNRSASGNVTKVGSTQTLFTAVSSGTVTGVTLLADSDTQSAVVLVAGADSVTMHWRVVVETTAVLKGVTTVDK